LRLLRVILSFHFVRGRPTAENGSTYRPVSAEELTKSTRKTQARQRHKKQSKDKSKSKMTYDKRQMTKTSPYLTPFRQVLLVPTDNTRKSQVSDKGMTSA
jgi:hypothetical protein